MTLAKQQYQVVGTAAQAKLLPECRSVEELQQRIETMAEDHRVDLNTQVGAQRGEAKRQADHVAANSIGQEKKRATQSIN